MVKQVQLQILQLDALLKQGWRDVWETLTRRDTSLWHCGASQICLTVVISSACLFHSEPQAHIVLPLQAYRCLYPLEL